MVITELLIQWNNPTYLMLLKLIMEQLIFALQQSRISMQNKLYHHLNYQIRQHLSVMIILCIFILVDRLYSYLLLNNCI